MIDGWGIVLLTAAALVAGTVSAILGMAGGTILQAVMLQFLPVGVMVPLHGVVQLCSNSTRLVVFFRHIEWGVVGRFAVGAAPGAALAYVLLQRFRPEANSLAERVLEVAIGLVILWATFGRKGRRERAWGLNIFLPVGFAVGLLGPFIGVTGPMTAPFFLRKNILKERLIATKAVCQAVGHLYKIPVFLALRFEFGDYTGLILAMIAAVVVGTLLGKRFLKRLSSSAFKRAVQVFLALVAAELLLGIDLRG